MAIDEQGGGNICGGYCTWIAPPHHVIVMSVLKQSDDIEEGHFYGD